MRPCSEGNSTTRTSVTARTTVAITTALFLIFAFQSTVAASEMKLHASDPSGADDFGNSVAISGNTLVVGGPGNDVGLHQSGSIYVFVRSGISWTQQVRLEPTDAGAEEWFGWSVAIDGDTIVAGKPNDDDACTWGCDSGSAYVFVRSGATWSQQAKLTADDGGEWDYFGRTVVIQGDTIVVGAPQGGPLWHQGAAYVFLRSGTTWMQQAQLVASDGSSWDEFGGALAIDGETILVGARLDGVADGCLSDETCGSGSAYVFVRSGGVWTEQAKLTADDASTWDHFGRSVAISGDVALVGAPCRSEIYFECGSFNRRPGRVYAFARTGSSWSQEFTFSAPASAPMDYFGDSLSILGDAVLIGAPGDDERGSDSGAAYVFIRSGPTWEPYARFAGTWGSGGVYFGVTVALEHESAVVGSPGDHDWGYDAGAAFVFEVDIPEPTSGVAACSSCPVLPLPPENHVGEGESGPTHGLQHSYPDPLTACMARPRDISDVKVPRTPPAHWVE